MRKTLMLALGLASTSVQATLDPVQECELYLATYEIVASVTGELVSDSHPTHRGLMAAVLSLSTQLQYQDGTETPEQLLANVKDAVQDVVNSTYLATCEEDL